MRGLSCEPTQKSRRRSGGKAGLSTVGRQHDHDRFQSALFETRHHRVRRGIPGPPGRLRPMASLARESQSQEWPESAHLGHSAKAVLKRSSRPDCDVRHRRVSTA